MSKKTHKIFIDDIISSINKINKYTKGISLNQFKKDDKTYDAVIRNLEIIGEAANNIPTNIRKEYKDIPWKEIIGMRNKMIHEYFGVDPEIVWQTIKTDLNELKKVLKKRI